MKHLIIGILTSLPLVLGGAAIAQTTWTGGIDGDLNNAGNWDNGLPTNDGTNDGTVPDGFPGLTGNPRDKHITFEGNSGYVGGNFGGAEANGYDVTFNGSGDADFTGNGLFLAWDGGAANDSSFTWNSTGTANITRFFTSRFGMGTFTQSAGTINQNNTGNFDMLGGEFGAPQDPNGGTTWVMTGGTLNSMASEFEPRFGTMEMSGGTINANNIKWDEGRGGSTFVWNFSGGTINAGDLTGFNNGDMFNFTAGSTGVLNVNNANYSIADAEADIANGWITADGAQAQIGDFAIAVIGANTEIRLLDPATMTTFTGAVDDDIGNAGNWDNGLPTNDGSSNGIVPDGFPALTGNPRDKNITFEGNSGYAGGNFGGAEANGYDVTFNGSGDADFTGNGLFLAWDGGAANDSSFTWNSTGTADMTRFFTNRFGMGTFTQTAGTINQNNTGNFDMIGGEFGAPQDPDGGTTWTMTGGTLNSMASEFEPRFGTMDMSGGTINANNIKWDEGRGGSSFVWNFSGGTINATDMTGFNNQDNFNFATASTGLLRVLNANYSVADAEADIANGWITTSDPAGLEAEVVDVGGVDYTELRVAPSLFGTIFTGDVSTDINNPGNWSNGLPTNDGTNDGLVPEGFPALTGSPRNKNITFEGNSGYAGGNFGNADGNGYNVTFNGSGNANFTGNGLFLAWDGGAQNDSSFTWNSTGTLDTTRWFTSRFGMGTFTHSAGTINQNNTGNFDMIVGEFGSPQDPAGGTTYIMTGGTLNSMASEFEPRFGTMDQSGGTINANNIKWDEGRGGSTFVWNFSGGTVTAQNMTGFNNGDMFNFTADSTGVLQILNSNVNIAAAEALISNGWITKDGAPATPAQFSIRIVDIDGVAYTEISAGAGAGFVITNFTRTGDLVTVTWRSSEGLEYALLWSEDMTDWGNDIDDGIPADPGDQTTFSFSLTDAGLENFEDLFFRIEDR